MGWLGRGLVWLLGSVQVGKGVWGALWNGDVFVGGTLVRELWHVKSIKITMRISNK